MASTRPSIQPERTGDALQMLLTLQAQQARAWKFFAPRGQNRICYRMCSSIFYRILFQDLGNGGPELVHNRRKHSKNDFWACPRFVLILIFNIFKHFLTYLTIFRQSFTDWALRVPMGPYRAGPRPLWGPQGPGQGPYGALRAHMGSYGPGPGALWGPQGPYGDLRALNKLNKS